MTYMISDTTVEKVGTAQRNGFGLIQTINHAIEAEIAQGSLCRGDCAVPPFMAAVNPCTCGGVKRASSEPVAPTFIVEFDAEAITYVVRHELGWEEYSSANQAQAEAVCEALNRWAVQGGA